MWDIRTFRLGQYYGQLHGTAVNSLDFHPNGQWLLTAGSDGTCCLCDVIEASRVFVIHGHEGAATSCKFSRSGHKIASGSVDEAVTLWNSNLEDYAIDAEDKREEERQQKLDKMKRDRELRKTQKANVLRLSAPVTRKVEPSKTSKNPLTKISPNKKKTVAQTKLILKKNETHLNQSESIPKTSIKTIPENDNPKMATLQSENVMLRATGDTLEARLALLENKLEAAVLDKKFSTQQVLDEEESLILVEENNETESTNTFFDEDGKMTPEPKIQEQVIIEEEHYLDNAIDVRSPILSSSSSRNSNIIQIADIETAPTNEELLQEESNKRNADLLAQSVIQEKITETEITPRENPPKKISLNPTIISNKPQITSVYMSDERRSSGGGHSLPQSKRSSGDRGQGGNNNPMIELSSHSLIEDDMPSSQPKDRTNQTNILNTQKSDTPRSNTSIISAPSSDPQSYHEENEIDDMTQNALKSLAELRRSLIDAVANSKASSETVGENDDDVGGSSRGGL